MRSTRRILAFLAIGCFGIVSAQNMKVLEIQGGSFNPKGARKAGLIFGANYGLCVDQRIDLTLGLSVYRKSFTEKTAVDSSKTGAGSLPVTYVTPLEYSTTIIPITASVTAHIPFQPPIGFYVGGSLAYELLFDKYTNYATNQTDNPRFSGFGWMARAGIEYALGSRSSIIAEGFYNSCNVKADRKKIEGVPSWQEVDLSGFGFKVGVRVELY